MTGWQRLLVIARLGTLLLCVGTLAITFAVAVALLFLVGAIVLGVPVEYGPVPFLVALTAWWMLKEDRVRSGRKRTREETPEDVDEVKGWKAARLNVTQGRLHFEGLVHGEYGPDDVATCRFRDHEAPQVECTCGFHVFRERGAARRTRVRHLGSCILEVDLYGTVIEHRRGSRGAEQVVLSAHLNPRCYVCWRRASGVARIEELGEAVPLCTRCTNVAGAELYTPERISAELGVEVKWARYQRRELLQGLLWQLRKER